MHHAGLVQPGYRMGEWCEERHGLAGGQTGALGEQPVERSPGEPAENEGGQVPRSRREVEKVDDVLPLCP